MWQEIKAGWRNFFNSITMRFNSIMAAVATVLPAMQDSVPQLKPYLAPKYFAVLMVATLVGNMLLRFKTRKPMSER